MKKIAKAVILICLIFACVSCVGVSTDINMKKNGSGRITLEYRYMKKTEAIGRLDGNENWPIIPVGKKDMERTVARINGLKLVSHSSKETSSQKNAEKDVLTKATLDFSTTQALLDFLDPAHEKSSLVQSGGVNTMTLILFTPATSPIDPDLINLLRDMSGAYQFKLNFSADKNASLSFTDGSGKPMLTPTGAQVIPSGKKVSFTIKTTDFFNYPQGLGLVITW